MCMELHYKDHRDRLPDTAEDEIMFAREGVTSSLILSDSVQNVWYRECCASLSPSRIVSQRNVARLYILGT